MRTLIFSLFCLCLFACNNQKASSVLNRDALITQHYKINPTKDTTLKTANGAIIEIDKESFSGNSGEVELQVKEAYSMEDIIKAGLTTRADGKPLSSGGMIFIDAVDDKTEIAKPIKVSLPTNNYDVEMQLYKGEEKGDEINWVQPTKLPDSLNSYIASAKPLFMANCATCHALDKQLTGPALRGVEYRGPWINREELIKFTKAPARYAATNCYAKNLISQFGQTMPAFPQLNDRNLNAMYDWIKSGDEKVNIKQETISTSCEDSCRRYDSIKTKVTERVTLLEESRQSLINDNGFRINYERLDSNGTGPMPTADTFPRGGIPKVSPDEYKSIYYRFDITSFGWYNIDKLIGEVGENSNSLQLSVDETLSKEINVFIAVPKYKVFDRGGKLSDELHYGFYGVDGKIPLPVGIKIIVFALGERDDKILFDYKEFISTSENNISLTPHLATKKEFNKAAKNFALDKIITVANDSKNADQIRRTDAEIKKQKETLTKWKPANCDCTCWKTDSTATTLISEK